jgi:CRP/FNR family cyclic AMP-dependent transcriptional regulator
MAVPTQILRSVPLFTGLTDTAISAVAEMAMETSYDEGAVLVREGDPGDRFIALVDGSARVERGGQPVATLGAGDFLGEIALVDGEPRTATVTATDKIRAFEIRRADFTALMDRSPVVRLGILMALTERVRARAAADQL